MAKAGKYFSRRKKETALLVDPDKFHFQTAADFDRAVHEISPSYIFTGGSFLSTGKTEEVIRFFKQRYSLPVILFPGDYAQLTSLADAVLFLTLLSGRNAEYLAAQQIKAAPLLKNTDIDVLSTAYILIEGGKLSTVQYITQTLPIPRNKPDLAVATALAGELMGMRYVYLEAGSGAAYPVPYETVKAVAAATALPVIVGGGIKPCEVTRYHEAGANLVVLGTYFEK